MEDAGRVRRGYFVAGLGAAQFAMPATLDLLRSLRDPPDTFKAVVLSATDPASPYGSLLEWPAPAWADEIARPGGPPFAIRGRQVAVPHARPAHSSSSWTAMRPAICAAANRSCCCACRRRNRRGRARHRPSRARSCRCPRRERRDAGACSSPTSTELPAATHPAARLFVEQGFLVTAMGLQLRPPIRDSAVDSAMSRTARRDRLGGSESPPGRRPTCTMLTQS